MSLEAELLTTNGATLWGLECVHVSKSRIVQITEVKKCLKILKSEK